MSIIMNVDHGRELTIQKVIGEVFYEEIITALINYWEDQPTKNLLWDCTRANMNHLFYDEARRIIAYDIPRTNERSGGKTALVGSGDVEFGILRTLKTLRDFQNPPYQIGVFRSLEEANQWLDQEEE